MLTRSQSFPARAPIRYTENYTEKKETTEELVYKDGFPETKRVNKKLCFLVYNRGIMEWWSIDEFLKNGVFTNEDVCDWIKHKNEVAKAFPNVKRKCLLCNRFALKGKTICFDYHKCEGVKAIDYIY